MHLGCADCGGKRIRRKRKDIGTDANRGNDARKLVLHNSGGGKKTWGFLLLASGYNSDGTFLIKKTEWIEFAKKHDLILVGLSFASNTDDLTNGKGYYYASKGSGQVFLDGLIKSRAESFQYICMDSRAGRILQRALPNGSPSASAPSARTPPAGGTFPAA